jgi:hypothetical protein
MLAGFVGKYHPADVWHAAEFSLRLPLPLITTTTEVRQLAELLEQQAKDLTR